MGASNQNKPDQRPRCAVCGAYGSFRAHAILQAEAYACKTHIQELLNVFRDTPVKVKFSKAAKAKMETS